MKRILLASSSPRRRELLATTGISFAIVRPDIDETPWPGEPADSYAARMSHEKALAVAAQPDALILTADTTVADGDDILGKPLDAADATAILARLRARIHRVHTGLSLLDTVTGEVTAALVTTEVVMRPYTDAEIAAYIASGDPFDKAGAYAVQNAGFHPVARLAGCYTNVMGLPVCAVCALMAARGVQVPHPPYCAPDRLPCELGAL